MTDKELRDIAKKVIKELVLGKKIITKKIIKQTKK